MEARTLSVALAAALLLMPSALAAWSVKGAWEPDTVYDASRSWMTLDPSPATPNVVYFNGFAGSGGPLATSANPNLATFATSYQAPPFVPVAMLGIWRDCNDDGFVGLGDQGLLEYRSELLLDDSFCPPEPTTPGAEWRTHHANGWVIELVPIGYDDTRTPEDENPFNLNDTSARVWADWGLPGDLPPLACPTTAMPHGTLRSTGGMLRYLDCHAGHRVAPAITFTARAIGQPGLGFGDAPPDHPERSSSPLNRPNPWGDASDAPMATAFDCSEQEDVEIGDPTDRGDGSGALHAVGPVNLTDDKGRFFNTTVADVEPDAPLTGSPAGTVNETQAATSDCDRNDADQVVDLDGERGGSDAELPYALEGPAEPLSPLAARTRTDHVLAFEEGLRGSGIPALALGASSRDDGGLGSHAVTGFWLGSSDAVGSNPFLSRAALGAEPVSLITYYAWIDPALQLSLGLVLPASAAFGIYGAEGCDEEPRTFECDPDLWWRDGAGGDATPRDARLGSEEGSSTTPTLDASTRIGVRIGQPYVLQDIDCVDSSAGAARQADVHWGRLSGTACLRPG